MNLKEKGKIINDIKYFDEFIEDKKNLIQLKVEWSRIGSPLKKIEELLSKANLSHFEIQDYNNQLIFLIDFFNQNLSISGGKKIRFYSK